MRVGCKMQPNPVAHNRSLPNQSTFKAAFFDGKTAAEQLVRVLVEENEVRVLNATGEIIDRVSLHNLFRPMTTSEQTVLAVGNNQRDRRIMIDRADVQPEVWAFLQTIPDKHRRSLVQPMRLILACALFILACFTTFTIIIPMASDRLVPFVSRGFEQTLGERLERTVLRAGPQNVCGSSLDNPDLLALAERLQTASGSSEPVSIHVIDLPVANAFALPSGRIFITRSLLDISQNADELISILAHEMGHVQAHHALRLSLRVGGSSAFLGFLLGDFTGSAAIMAIGQVLIGTSFSREFEREADELAVQILHTLGVSPMVLANMLERLEARGQQAGLLATHPMTADRADFLSQATIGQESTMRHEEAEILSIQRWKSLKLICD